MLDVIICANCDVKKLRGLGNTGGQILEFPIEMAGHPYNSAALLRRLWYTTTMLWFHDLIICLRTDLFRKIFTKAYNVRVFGSMWIILRSCLVAENPSSTSFLDSDKSLMSSDINVTLPWSSPYNTASVGCMFSCSVSRTCDKQRGVCFNGLIRCTCCTKETEQC